METNEKRKAILDETKSRKGLAAKIDPGRKGSTISEMRKGKPPVSDDKVDELYSNLLLALEQGIAQPQAQVKAQKAQHKHKEDIEQLKKRNSGLEEENRKLKEQMEQIKAQGKAQIEQGVAQAEQAQVAAQSSTIIDRLTRMEERLAAIEKAQVQAQVAQVPAQEQAQKPTVLGFHLIQKTTTTEGKPYRKWYATRSNKVVYIGNDPGKAEAKIRVYCDKAGIQI